MSSTKSQSIKSDKKDKKMALKNEPSIDDIINDLNSRDDMTDKSDTESDTESDNGSDNGSDNESDIGDSIPDVTEININSHEEENEDDNQIKTLQEIEVDKVINKNTKKPKATKTPKTPKKGSMLTTTYSKKKDIAFNLMRLKNNLQLSETDKKNVFSFQDKNNFMKNFKFPTWASLSKKSKLDNLEHPTLIITDDNSIELKLKQNLILYTLETNKQNSILFLNIIPYYAFMKLFLDLRSDALPFSVLQSLISLFLISDKIIFTTKFKISSYIFFLLAKKLEISDKIVFTSENSKICDIDKEYSDNIKEEFDNIDINTDALYDFLKLNKLPSTITEHIMLEIFKMFNFKSQLKNESFDGLTKIILKNIKKDKLYKKDFSFLTMIGDLSDEYPMIPEKEILQHYSYILNNFNKNSQIPLFEFNDTKITNKTRVKVNKILFDKILSLTVIVKKSYGEFWTCLIPFQLFYAKDFYALDLNKILDYFVKNDTNKVIQDDDGRLYKHINNKGIVNLKKNYQLELTGAEKNILKYFDPTISKEEFILKLINGNVPHTIKDNSIIINDTKKVLKYIKFQLDKENTIFNFKNVIIMGKNEDKINHYNNVVKYYNDYINFNLKLFRCYMIQYLILKNSNPQIIQMLKDVYEKEAQTTAPFNPYKYPASYNINEKNMVFETNLFDSFKTDINENFNVDECATYLKNKTKELYFKFISN